MSYQVINYELVLTPNTNPSYWTVNHRFTLQNISSANLAGGQEARPGMQLTLRETIPGGSPQNIRTSYFNIDPISIGQTEQRYVPVADITNPATAGGRILKSNVARVDNAIFFVFNPSGNVYSESTVASSISVDDGSPKVLNGYKGYRTLEEYDILTGRPTGQTKPNVESDPDYVHPAFDPDSCPIGV